MRVESALYASSLGLQANGGAIAVIGDNISNSNTTGFKESRIEFGDLMPQGPDGYQTDVVSNVGAGVQVTGVRPIFDNGVLEFTGRQLDLAIDGNGFFITGTATDPVYSRAGNLTVDSSGFLSTADGTHVLGFQGSGTTIGDINMRNFSTSSTPTTKVSVVGNLDTSQALATTIPSKPATFNDLAKTASYITNATAFDSQGVSHDITLAFSKKATNTWIAQAYIDGGEVGGAAGAPVQVGADATLSFGPDGQLTAAGKTAATIDAKPAYINGSAGGAFTIDLSSFTQFGNQSQVASITKDGQGAGEVQGYEFQKDGTITAQLSSGSHVEVGKIQLADFQNRDGLIRAGNGGYKATTEAGTPTTGSPLASGLGAIQGGSLERSTVDIANEFVDLVTYQRGYQANSQTLSATNQILRDTLSLIR